MTKISASEVNNLRKSTGAGMMDCKNALVEANGDLDKAIQDINLSLPSILLSHDPSHWENVVLSGNYNIDLQLSGHTHGMQFGIEIPGFKWSPAQYRYKQWAGLYSKHNKQIYINRGIGHLGYAGRVGIMPDISILNIKSI